MRTTLIVAAAAVVMGGQAAMADLHTWDINEIYSNSSGSIQFIELEERDGLNGQERLSSSGAFPHTLSSNSQTYTFTTDLPSNQTAFKKFLVATSGFTSLPGAVTPDYIIPDNFFSIAGDTLTFSNVDTFSFTADQYPSNPNFSL